LQKLLVVSVAGSAAVVGSLVIAGIALSRPGGPASTEAADLSSIESEISALRESVESLTAEVRAVRAAQESSPGFVVPVPAEGGDTAEASAEAPSSSLPGYVAAVLAEERKQADEERERQREERRTRMEARRQELEAMREGPYDRYNVKVNSLGKVLALTEAQKRSYYDLTLAYGGKLEEGMKQMREAREARRAAAAAENGQGQPDAEGRRGFGRGARGEPGARDQFRELQEGLQKSFAADVASLLSAEQAQLYGELSRSAQSFQSTDMVSASGEDGGRFAGFGRGGADGTGGGGPGGGGRRGR
jgi:hypothetical protein